MDYKLEDNQILDEEETNYWIGPKNKPKKKKKLTLYLLAISEYYDEFVPRFVVFLEWCKNTTEKLVLPTGKDWKDKKKMNKLQTYFRQLFSNRLARRDFINLLNRVGYLDNMSKRFFSKYVDPLQLISIFLYVYKHNVDGLKKKLQQVLKEAMSQKELSPIFTEALSKEGGQREKLRQRFRRLKK